MVLMFPTTPRKLKTAIRLLGSENWHAHTWATAALQHADHLAYPLLLAAASATTPSPRAIYAALILHQLGYPEGGQHLMRLIDRPFIRESSCAPLLRNAVLKTVGSTPFLQKLATALAQLEQRPDLSRPLAHFHHNAQILLFLRSELPLSLLHRALLVRAIGGENLSIVRLVLDEAGEPNLEHISLVRRDSVALLISSTTQEHALQIFTNCLLHPNPAVQLTTMFGLKLLKQAHAINALYPIAHDPSSPVREDAQNLIRYLNPQKSDPFVLLRPIDEERFARSSLLRASKTQPSELLRPLFPAHNPSERSAH
jgi:hypothetical protein